MRRAPSEKTLATRLGDVPLFASTSMRRRRHLARLGRIITWADGSTPIHEGDFGVGFFLLLDGRVEVVRRDQVLATLVPGDFVGEMALLTGAPRNADVRAVMDTTVYSLGRAALAAAIKADPGMGMTLLEAVARRQTSIQ